MPLKEVYLPDRNARVRLGRLAPPPGTPKLRLSKYLAAKLPTPPAQVNYAPEAMGPLSNIYLNDRYGDCVIAGGYHILAAMTGNAGTPFVASSAQIVADYSAIGGFNPSFPNATDHGCNEADALNYWTSHGFADGTKLLGWAAIDATDPVLVRQCLWLFENVMFGVAMPDAWVGRDMPRASGFTWDVAGPPNSHNGHCFIATGYTKDGPQIDTWGKLGTLTDAAVARYAVPHAGGELYVLLSDSILIGANKKSPNGIDLNTLIADLNAMGGQVAANVPPAPIPTPPAAD